MLTSNMGDVLARRARRNPGLEAVVDMTSGERVTYAELDRRANRVAHMVAGLGTQPGDRVGLLVANSVEFIECFYGVAKSGRVIVLLNWRLVADELEYLLNDSGATSLIFSEDFAGVVVELQERGTTSVTTWVCIGSPGGLPGGSTDGSPGSTTAPPPFAQSYSELTAAANDTAPADTAPADTARQVATGPDDILCLCYSSGTTGRPKGAMLTHEGQMWAVMSNVGSADYRLGDRWLMVMPLFHLGGILPMEVAIFTGATIVIVKAFEPNRVWDVVGQESITSGLLVPAMLNALLLTFDPDRHDLSSVRNFWTAGAPCPVTLIEQCIAKGIGLLQTYGLTEAGGPGTILAAEHAAHKVGSSGAAYLLTDVRVVRTDGADCDPEEPGEVLIRGRHVMKGYWNNPTATASTVVDGWLHTGDIATADSEGFVTIRDRVKDMIISGGENIYPAELENVILSHAGVREVAVIAQPSAKWGESPLAVVVRADGHDDLRADEILAWCDGRVARYKMPKAVEFAGEIPRNPTGKALKRILRERFPGPAPE
jgi:acyl-CoA synthetase (AMP-forming)/AMP-acid ligase II